MNPFDELDEFLRIHAGLPETIRFTKWREKWEPILSEWEKALREVDETDPLSIKTTLLRWRWRALHSERRLEAVKPLLEKMSKEPGGAWNNDPLTYTKNVVHWCMDKATEALKILEGEE